MNFLSCAITLPIGNAVKIAQKSLDEEWYDFIQSDLFTEKYSKLLERLFSENKLDLATRIFELMFAPISKSETCPKLLDKDPYSEDHQCIKAEYPFGEYWYKEYLTNVLSALKSKHFELSNQLLFLLEKALDIEHSKTDELKPSTYWRPSIEEHKQNWDFDIKSLYVSKLQSCLVELGKNDIFALKSFMNVTNKKKVIVNLLPPTIFE